jgi:hypothetical protein
LIDVHLFFVSSKYNGRRIAISMALAALGPSLSQENVHVKNISGSEEERSASLLVSPGAHV